ncbi:RTA1 like protein-domain-containing protein [Bisporella sp. PMI_857]|nr:RTA1 like protein-domain-containing protein [Bisporella sp. PMI_857]
MASHAPTKYQQNPSLPVVATIATLFGLSAGFHIIQLLHNRTWYFVPFTIGTILVGYAARSINASQTPDWVLVPFLIQTLVPMLGPAPFTASTYVVLGRIIRFVDAEHLSFKSTRSLTKIFVSGDVLSFLVQFLGGSILAGASSKNAFYCGQNIIFFGLGIQIIFFGCFIIAVFTFHYRIIQLPTTISLQTKLPWGQYIAVLYFSSFLALARSILRVAKFATGQHGAIQMSEIYLYCFDSALMLLCSAAFNVPYLSQVESRRNQTTFTSIEPDDTRSMTE